MQFFSTGLKRRVLIAILAFGSAVIKNRIKKLGGLDDAVASYISGLSIRATLSMLGDVVIPSIYVNKTDFFRSVLYVPNDVHEHVSSLLSMW